MDKGNNLPSTTQIKESNSSSLASSSSSSSSTTSSPPRYTDNVLPSALPRNINLAAGVSQVPKLHRLGNATAADAIVVSNGSDLESALPPIPPPRHLMHNKILVGRHNKTPGVVSTKEEKQRQNEEIVTLESSSISSEAGSCESTETLKFRDTQMEPCSLAASSGGGGCFIDASSLIDENEVATDEPILAQDNENNEHEIDEDAEKLVTFQKCNIAAYKTKLENSHSSSSSCVSEDSPPKMGDSDGASNATNTTNNLSDEEKLWKRDHVSHKIKTTDKDDDPKQQMSTCDDVTEASVSLAAEIDSSDSSEIVKLRHNAGAGVGMASGLGIVRKPPGIYAMHQIQPFSIHPLSISPKFSSFSTATTATAATMASSDMSYTTDYSSSSPAPSLVWSEHESRTRTSMLPDTPHNSMVLVESNASNASSIHQRDSGAYCSDATDSPVPLPRTPRRSKCDESNVIVSGGASVEDHAIKQCDSPSLKRRLDTCPIVSGGFVARDFETRKEKVAQIEDEEEEKVEMRVKPNMASWVVDMSDCRNSNSSLDSNGKNAGNRSCGFYVPLGEAKKVAAPLSKSYTQPTANEKVESDKKQIFSLFIDIGGDERKTPPRKEVPLNLAQRLNAANRVRCEDSMKSSTSSTETLMSKSKLGVDAGPTESNNVATPPLRQKHRQLANDNSSSKRHSWDISREAPTNQCKRSISLNNNNNSGLMCIIDKLPLISATDNSVSPLTGSMSELGSSHSKSSLSDEEPVRVTRVKLRQRDAQINETYDKSSLVSITDSSLLSKDMSPLSTTTDTDDLTFQQDEELAIRETNTTTTTTITATANNASRACAQIMETIIETKEQSSPKKVTTMETLHATIEKQKMLLETVNEHSEAMGGRAAFVKLSDLDKPANKQEMHSPDTYLSRSMSGSNHRQFQRMYRDNRPHSWTMTRSTGHSLLNITSSVDNLRSLTRLFPHFSHEITSSLPNDMTLDAHLVEYAPTDVSGDSSLASSFSRSAMDESSISCRQPRRLGEDLLKMFLQEIATDMVVEVHGRRLRAHKCILRSRCQYFAAMLAGHDNQHSVSLQGYSYAAVHFALCHIYSGASHPPDGISLMELAALADLLGLEGLKEVTAHALKINYCHNFHKPCSGCIDGILQVLPVALNHALDDLYRKCLRWTCRHYLKVWTSRQFSQLPTDILGRCRQQIVAYMTSETVLDTLLDCDNLLLQVATCSWGGMPENLVRDILDAAHTFIAEHFASLIASDAFLSLGHDRSCHIPHLEGILLRIASSLNADQACRSYQRVTRLNTVLQANALQLPGNLSDLAKELQGLQQEDLDWHPEYMRLVSALLSAVEQCLIRQCSRAMRVTAWQRMDLNLRKKIQTLAHLSDPLEMKRVRATVTKNQFSLNGTSRNQDLYQVKLAIQAHTRKTHDPHMFHAAHTYTQTVDPVVHTIERGVQASQNDAKFSGVGKILKSNSRAYVPQSLRQTGDVATHRRTQSSDGVMHHNRNTLTENVKAAATVNVSKKPAPIRLVDVRPRYMEPRKLHNNNNNNNSISSGPVRSATSSCIPSASKNNNKKLRQLSSSDSSRHSSPATRKNAAAAGGGCAGAINRYSNNSKVTTTKATGSKVKELLKSSQHISMDSLAKTKSNSGSVRSKLSDNDGYSDIGMDSMAESMRSSIITNKTISQESLKNMSSVFSRSNPVIMMSNAKNPNNRKQVMQTRQQQQQQVSAKPSFGLKCAPQKKLSTTKTQHQQYLSTGSSPSSLATSKSAASRLSSVSSTQSSRDLYKNRSISVPGQQQQPNGVNGGQQRFSFLSAKSREILAKRAEKNKFHLQQQKNDKSHQNHDNNDDDNDEVELRVPTVMRSASTNNATGIGMLSNRSSLPTNIPMRRPNTLHIKKNNSLNYHHSNYNQKQQHETNKTTTNVEDVDKKKKNKIKHNEHNNDVEAVEEDEAAAMISSTLQRSSTFCKDSPALNINQLQIIE